MKFTLLFLILSIPIFLFLELKYQAGKNFIKKSKKGFMVCGKAEKDAFSCLDVMERDRKMYRRAFIIYFSIVMIILFLIETFFI